MKVIRWIFLITYFLGTAFFANAQSMEDLLQKANVAYSDLEFYNAAKIYERYYRVDSTNYSIIYRLADCYWNMRNYDSARIWYNKIPIDSILSNPILTRRFAEVYAISGDYKQAAKIYSNLKNFHIREYGFIHRDLFLRDSADWTIRYLNINTQKYREFSPMLLGSSIIWSTNEPNRKNTGDINGWDAKGFIHLNFLPSQNDIRYNDFPLSKTTMKSVKEKKAKNISRTFSAADVAIRHKGYGFSGIQKISKPDNERVQNLKIIKKLQYNIGHATASYAASKIYMTVNRQDKTSRNPVRLLGIVEADIMANRIANPSFVPIYSTNPSDSNEIILHAAIDPMGKHLVFSSNRSGGKGGFDLYTSVRSLDGKWSIPEPIENLNTAGDEVFSNFSPNGEFYFSSNGRAGLGGLDLYKVKVKVAPYIMSLLFGNPEHLSYPINSDHDDFGLVLSADTLRGYFTSDRFGTDDIFSFDFRPKYVVLNGSVVDRITKSKAEGIKVSLYEEAENGKIILIDSVTTNNNGSYTFLKARPNRDYVIKIYEPIKSDSVQDVVVIRASTNHAVIEKELALAVIDFAKSSNMDSLLTGKEKISEVQKSALTYQSDIVQSNYTFNEYILLDSAINLSLKSTPENSYYKNIQSDSFFAIIYFGFDLHSLTSKAITILDSVINYMRSNPTDEFILFGHSDEVGDIQYNIDLSKKRVIEVAKYIGNKGIDTKRLKLSYFGEQYPAKINSFSKRYQRFNRRVEFILIKNNSIK